MVHGCELALFHDAVLLWEILLRECLFTISTCVGEVGRKYQHTVLSLESPIFLPINSFIHCDVLPSSLDWRPGTTRGILKGLSGVFILGFRKEQVFVLEYVCRQMEGG